MIVYNNRMIFLCCILNSLSIIQVSPPNSPVEGFVYGFVWMNAFYSLLSFLKLYLWFRHAPEVT